MRSLNDGGAFCASNPSSASYPAESHRAEPHRARPGAIRLQGLARATRCPRDHLFTARSRQRGSPDCAAARSILARHRPPNPEPPEPGRTPAGDRSDARRPRCARGRSFGRGCGSGRVKAPRWLRRRANSLLELIGGSPDFMRQSSPALSPPLHPARVQGHQPQHHRQRRPRLDHARLPRCQRRQPHAPRLPANSPVESDPSLLEEIAPGFFADGTVQNDPAVRRSFIPTASSRALDG